MGRPRVVDPSLPAHIDPASIPKGAYWSKQDRVWFTIINDGIKSRRRKIAGSSAKLSDLQLALEAIAGVKSGTVGWLCDLFAASAKFQTLAANTQRDYELQRQFIAAHKLKSGIQLRDVPISALSVAAIQRLIDKLAENTPAKANHLHRYLRMLFAWGIRRGYCVHNPARGVEQAKERKRRRLPSTSAQNRLLAFAKAGAALKPHTEGSIAPYVWIAMELTYLCRLRGIEAITLTDAHYTEIGGLTNRRKGSRDSLVRWSPRLTDAWQAAVDIRTAIWKRLEASNAFAYPLHAKDRPLLVNQKGLPVTRSGMDTIWQSFMRRAIEAGVIEASERFGLHDLKRKGTTDTKGRQEKLEGGGWKEERMLDTYDLSIPEVDTPGGV